MIFDCFIFFNEFDLLKIRCEELKDLDVCHVLVESAFAFNGKKKPLYFQERADEFSEYNIVGMAVYEAPNNGNYFDNEIFQRNKIKDALEFFTGEEPNDTIIISDIDEIPRASEIADYTTDFGFMPILMEKYNYYLNLKERGKPWDRARIFPYSALKDVTIDQARNSGYDITLSNGGWHFSWLGGWDEILKKLDTTHHQEFNTEEFRPKFKKHFDNGEFFVDGKKMDTVIIDKTFPKYIYKNQKMFSKLIKK